MKKFFEYFFTIVVFSFIIFLFGGVVYDLYQQGIKSNQSTTQNFTFTTSKILKKQTLPNDVIAKPKTLTHQGRINNLLIDGDQIYSVSMIIR